MKPETKTEANVKQPAPSQVEKFGAVGAGINQPASAFSTSKATQ